MPKYLKLVPFRAGVKARMSDRGTLETWEDEKGYGFIRHETSGKKMFAHIRDFTARHPRPIAGDRVEFIPGADKTGRPCAKKILRPELHSKQHSGGAVIPILVCAYLLFLGFQTYRSVFPDELPLVIAVLSLLSYLQYGHDKNLARRHAFRTPEARLHFIDLLGGWPGGWLAQRRYRHKLSKPSFMAAFYVTAFLNMGFLFHYLAAPPGWWRTHTHSQFPPVLAERITQDLAQIKASTVQKRK